jgi:hypothetical protein
MKVVRAQSLETMLRILSNGKKELRIPNGYLNHYPIKIEQRIDGLYFIFDAEKHNINVDGPELVVDSGWDHK